MYRQFNKKKRSYLPSTTTTTRRRIVERRRKRGGWERWRRDVLVFDELFTHRCRRSRVCSSGVFKSCWRHVILFGDYFEQAIIAIIVASRGAIIIRRRAITRGSVNQMRMMMMMNMMVMMVMMIGRRIVRLFK